MTEVEVKPDAELKKDEEVEKVETCASKIPEDATDKNSSDAKSKEPASEENPPEENISQLEKDIIKQMEYYFGDSNLMRDKFLIEQIGKNDGWVPFSVLLTFKRLASLSSDAEVIVKALEKSDEGLIEINEDKTEIRRHPERPLPERNEEVRKEISSRSAYVKGFALDTDMSDIIDFFNPYEKVLNIIMRKYLDKPTKKYKFKGSIFVTFAKKEQCEEFVNKEKVVFRDVELIRKWQDQYLEEKKEERAHNDKKKNKVEENKFELPKGTVLYFEGCSENVTREHIKEAFINLSCEVAYIEYSKGEPNGYIRFCGENTAKPILEKLEENKLKIEGDVELTFRALTEEEEKEFLGKAAAHMKSRRNNSKHHNKGGNRKRKNNESRDEPPSKK